MPMALKFLASTDTTMLLSPKLLTIEIPSVFFQTERLYQSLQRSDMFIEGRYVQFLRSSCFESRLSRFIGDPIGEERNVHNKGESPQFKIPTATCMLHRVDVQQIENTLLSQQPFHKSSSMETRPTSY